MLVSVSGMSTRVRSPLLSRTMVIIPRPLHLSPLSPPLCASSLSVLSAEYILSAGGGGDEEDPCPAEGEACFADGACIGALPGEDGDMTACFANELCGALMQCHMDANEEDPCPAEGGACYADDTCVSVLPEQESDMDACFANELCGALLQCHMDADPGGGGGPPECVAAQFADCGEDFGKSSTISLLRLWAC